MRQEIKLRHGVKNTEEFIRWARGAVYGDFCVYHVGSLSTDRRSDPDLSHLADTVLLLQDTGFIVATQYRRDISAETQYTATRTGRGYAPRAVMKGEISAGDWRILNAISEARHGRSITRIVRDILATSSDKAAVAVLDAFKVRDWVEEDPAVAGWKISALGLSMLA